MMMDSSRHESSPSYSSDAGTTNTRQTLDLLIPEQRSVSTPLPVIAFIHGGGWRAGDKSSGMPGPSMEPLIRPFLDHHLHGLGNAPADATIPAAALSRRQVLTACPGEASGRPPPRRTATRQNPGDAGRRRTTWGRLRGSAASRDCHCGRC